MFLKTPTILETIKIFLKTNFTFLNYNPVLTYVNLTGGVNIYLKNNLKMLMIVGVCNCSMFYVLLYVTLCPFYYCNHLMGKRELVALLGLSSWCLVVVEQLFRAVHGVVCML